MHKEHPLPQLPHLQSTLSNHQSYQTCHQPYKKSLSQHNNQIILCAGIAISRILQGDVDPYAKLLAMRFVRECWDTGAYGWFTVVNAVVGNGLVEVGMWRKGNQGEDRGQDLFLGGGRWGHDQVYLRRLGVSFHKIVLEMYEAMSQIMPYCPYNTHPIPSTFSTTNTLLKSLKITYPASRTYYKQPLLSKVTQIYTQNQHQQSQQQNIPKFYKYLLSLLSQPLLHQEVKKLYRAIIETGDQYCVGFVLGYLRDVVGRVGDGRGMGKEEVGGIVGVVDGLVRIGDVEVIWGVQETILIDLIQAYRKDLITQQQLGIITGWGADMAKAQTTQFDIDGYLTVTKHLTKPKQKQPTQTTTQQLLSQLEKLKPNNSIKLTYLKRNRSHLPELEELVRQVSEENQVKIYQISVCNQEKEGKEGNVGRKQEKQEIVQIQPDRQELIQQFNTPKSKISSRFLQSSKKPSNSPSIHSIHSSSNMTPHPKLPSSNPNFNLNSQPSHQFRSNQKVRKSSIDVYSIESQSNRKDREKDKEGEKGRNQEYYGYGYGSGYGSGYGGIQRNMMEELESQIKMRIEKERMLKAQLDQKDEIIRKLTAKSIKKSQNQNRKRFSVDTSTIINLHPQHPQPSHVPPLPPLEIEPYKHKKNNLKKKVLLLQNSTVQIGLITKMKPKSNIMECSIFFTAFVQLRDFCVYVSCDGCSWLESWSNRVQGKERVDVEMQCVVVVELGCCLEKGKIRESGDAKPILTISYKNTKTNQQFTQKIPLPIHINKTCQNIPISPQQLKTLTSSPPPPQTIQLTQQIPLDHRILHNFDSFLKYFPHAVKLEGKVFVALMEGIAGRFWVEVAVKGKNQAVLKVRQEGGMGKGMEVLEEVFRVYKGLFSVSV